MMTTSTNYLLFTIHYLPFLAGWREIHSGRSEAVIEPAFTGG